jgi:hypothetical protein
MKSTNPNAKNLFARITSLAVEEGSNRIENVCTEILAWSLLHSLEFQRSFFRLMDIPFTACHIHTQIGFSSKADTEAEEEETTGTRGCLDVLFLSEDSKSLAVAVEVKAWSDFRERQLPDYREALERHYREYNARRLISLTPFPESPPGVHRHIEWGQVAKALDDIEDETLQKPLAQFSEFLIEEGLGFMKLDKFDAKVLAAWQVAAPAFEQWSELFKKFANYPRLKAIFQRALKQPKIETEPDRAWLGVWSSGSPPWVYAGVGSVASKGGYLWLSLMVPGKKASAVRKMPAKLKGPFKAATALLNRDVYESANLGKNASDGNTYFDFAQPITAEFNGRSETILKWFDSTVVAARDFGKALSD